MNIKTQIITALELLEGKRVTRAKLLQYLHRNGFPQLSDRKMRMEIKAVNKEGLNCIGSDLRGYFIIGNGEQREAYKQAMKAKIYGLWNSFKEADSSYAAKFGGKQINLLEEISAMEIKETVLTEI